MRYGRAMRKANPVGRPRKIDDPRALSIRLPGPLYDRVAVAAEARGISLNDAAVEALTAWLRVGARRPAVATRRRPTA
jgi:predicted HicB family RNase H-like nuclease